MEKTTRKRGGGSWEWLHSRWLPYVLLALFMLFVHAGMDTRVGDDKVNLQVLSEIGGGQHPSDMALLLGPSLPHLVIPMRA